MFEHCCFSDEKVYHIRPSLTVDYKHKQFCSLQFKFENNSKINDNKAYEA